MEREAPGKAGQQDAMRHHALEVTGVSKAYGATVALQHADLALRAGHVLALLGENGAGKSTLVRILSGVVSPDTGEMAVHGTPYKPRSISEARASQVATAFQELSLVPNLSVAQNLMLPRLAKSAFGLVSRRHVLTKGEEILNRHGLSRIDPDVEVSQLPLSDRQRIEIARAIENAGRVLILDEPTAALAETDWIFEQISKAKQRGVAILYISHRLAEVREICTSATVLRNGRSIATVGLEQATDGDIFEMMVGHRVDTARQNTPKTARDPKLRVQVSDLHGEALNGVSFEINQGEVLGVAALEG
jgi:ribose transport system ATP-binding protein